MNLLSISNEHFPELAALIDQHGRQPSRQCLHACTGEAIPALIEEMEQLAQKKELLYVGAWEQNKLVGALGCEFDPESGRGWLRGPLIEESRWPAAQALYDHLSACLPANINRLDSFLNAQNNRGQAFYISQGFEYRSAAHVYQADRPASQEKPAGGRPREVHPLRSESRDEFEKLHDRVFPDTYYTGAQITGLQGDNHRVFLWEVDKTVAGYVYVVVEPWASEGYIEFLGVDESFRGRGGGGLLLDAALTWAFSDLDMPQVGLTVSDQNTNARRLYERAGFHLKYSGVNHRKILTEDRIPGG
jgi:ribosomal protein S18 acetylase RimI-like enzyme